MKRLLTLAILVLTFVPTAWVHAAYKDVSVDHIYMQGISYVELQGGSANAEQFRPDALINRAEAMKLLFGVLGKQELPNSVLTLKDLPADAWFTPYLRQAIHYDLFKSQEGKIHPEAALQRAETYAVLLKAYGFTGKITPENGRTPLYKDVSTQHSDYETIHRAIELGLLKPNPEISFKPYEKITRGEYAQLLYQMDTFNLYNRGANFYKSDIMDQVWETITEQYYLPNDYKIDPEVLFQAAIKGLMESLQDPYSRYFTPEEGADFTSYINGEVEGIGAYLFEDELTQEVSISGFLDDSPAEDVGMQIGDIIKSVNGESVEGISAREVGNKIRGKEGTDVVLEIERNELRLSFTVTRMKLQAKSVKAEIFENKVWMLTLRSFTGEATAELRTAFADLKEQVDRPSAIVIDLRGNGGGLTDLANDLSGYFLPKDTPLMQFRFNNSEFTITNKKEGSYQHIPLYILMNGQTASASEIVAATLKEQANATLIGTQTFGKGTAQRTEQFWDGSVIKFTIAEWLTSKGKSIQGIGLTPDVVLTADEASEPSAWMDALRNALY